jgi:hypothetical protein
MARFKNHLLVVVGFAIAGMIGAAFGTGTAQAVVASLVEVVNPGTSPVPTSVTNPATSPVLNSSVDDAGRIAYQSIVINPTCNGFTGCVITFPIVPTGHRLVILHLMGNIAVSTSSTSFVAGTSPISGTFLIGSGTIFRFNSAAPVFGFNSLNDAVQLYVDAGNAPGVAISTNGEFLLDPQISLTGYELDCTVAACAPIATQ